MEFILGFSLHVGESKGRETVEADVHLRHHNYRNIDHYLSLDIMLQHAKIQF